MALTRTIVYEEAIRLMTSEGPILLIFGKGRVHTKGKLCDQISIDAPPSVKIDRIPRPEPKEAEACPPKPEKPPASLALHSRESIYRPTSPPSASTGSRTSTGGIPRAPLGGRSSRSGGGSSTSTRS